MPRKFGFQFRFVPFALCVSVLGLALLVILVLQSEKTFPSLPIGAFVGRISGVGSQGNQSATLYIERTAVGDRLLVVVFREGWRPQVVSLEPSQKTEESPPEAGTTLTFKPIVLRETERIFQLHGTVGKNEYSGDVLCQKKKVGTWSLHPISVENLRRDVANLNSQFDLEEWLRLKAEYHKLTRELDGLDSLTVQKQEKYETLTKVVEEEDSLRQRSEKRRTELAEKLEEVKTDFKERREEVRRLVNELQQLTRITRRGRSIDLARRVSKRENKWYFVNWQQDEDLSALEESLAEKMDIDLRKLKEKVKRAEEIQNLKNTVAKERNRVRELQRIYREKIDAETREKKQPKKPKYKRPWWERWDTVFGWMAYE